MFVYFSFSETRPIQVDLCFQTGMLWSNGEVIDTSEDGAPFDFMGEWYNRIIFTLVLIPDIFIQLAWDK